MADERDLPPRDARWVKIAPPMEHGAPAEVLPVDNGADNDTPHFQFISFKLIFTIYNTF